MSRTKWCVRVGHWWDKIQMFNLHDRRLSMGSGRRKKRSRDWILLHENWAKRIARYHKFSTMKVYALIILSVLSLALPTFGNDSLQPETPKHLTGENQSRGNANLRKTRKSYHNESISLVRKCSNVDVELVVCTTLIAHHILFSGVFVSGPIRLHCRRCRRMEPKGCWPNAMIRTGTLKLILLRMTPGTSSTGSTTSCCADFLFIPRIKSLQTWDFVAIASSQKRCVDGSDFRPSE